MSNYTVSQNADGTWSVKKDNAEHASVIAKTQAEAQKKAKELCHNSGGGEVRIKGRDGKIRDSDTIPPGNDPYPPEDKVH